MGNISLGSFRRAVEDVRINGMVMNHDPLLHALHIVSTLQIQTMCNLNSFCRIYNSSRVDNFSCPFSTSHGP